MNLFFTTGPTMLLLFLLLKEAQSVLLPTIPCIRDKVETDMNCLADWKGQIPPSFFTSPSHFCFLQGGSSASAVDPLLLLVGAGGV